MFFKPFNIIFGKDGNFYIKKENRSDWIKEDFFKREILSEKSDINSPDMMNYIAWPHLLTNDVYFEAGITWGAVWECLRTSANFWSSFLNIDVVAYLDELNNSKGSRNNTNISSIAVFLSSDLNRVNDATYSFDYLNNYWTIAGLSKLPKKELAVSNDVQNIPLNKLKNVPFYFRRSGGTFFEISPKSSIDRADINYHEKEAKISLMVAMNAIFKDFKYSPQDRTESIPISKSVLKDLYAQKIEQLRSEGVVKRGTFEDTIIPQEILKKTSNVLNYNLKKIK